MSRLELDDGRTVTIRAIEPEDSEALRAMHRGLSRESVYSRFFAQLRELPPAQAERFTHVDGTRRVALVAESDHGDLVGVGRYDRDPVAFERAEVAFVVADAYQHHGLGTHLVKTLVEHARSEGVTTLVADVLATNIAMLHAFRDAGLTATSTIQSGVAHLVMPLVSGPSGEPSSA